MKRFATVLLFSCFSILSFSNPHDAELILNETNISLKTGKLVKSIRYEIRINNRAGESLTNITIPYSKLIRVSNLEATIRDTNGVIIKKLQKNDITDKSAISDFSLYEDNYEKEFTLRHNIYPYIISYSYLEQQEEFLMIEKWIPVIDWKTPTLRAVLTLEIPRDYKIAYRSKLTDSFKCDSSDLFLKYTWTASYTSQNEPENSSPEILTFLPSVTIAPIDFKYDTPGSLATWTDFGNWQNSLIRDLSDLPQSEKYKINELTKGISDERQKIKILYRYLQENTRYINVTIETGGMKPFPASYVAANKFGDCKALSNYFKSVLECAGIRSYYTKVYAGDQIVDIDKSFPSQQFNHIILCVPVQQDTIWLDCTSDMAFGYLGTFSQARDVFIVEAGNSHFTRTPELTAQDVAEIRKVSFHHDNENQTIANFSISYGGDNYENYFSLYNSVNETDRSKIFRKYVVTNGFELVDFKMEKPSPDSARIDFSYSASSNRTYKAYGNDMIIEVLPFTVPKFEDPKNRKLPAQLDYPVSETDSLEYDIPAEYNVIHKLNDQTLTSDFGVYKCASSIKNNKVFVVKSFNLFPGRYSLEKYKEFYEFLSKVTNIENSNRIVANKKL